MASSKIAITVPEEILAEVDEAARERGQTRSAFISGILRTAIRARRDAEITRRLNELFADESMASDQRRTAREMDSVGTDWSVESWE